MGIDACNAILLMRSILGTVWTRGCIHNGHCLDVKPRKTTAAETKAPGEGEREERRGD